VLVDAIAGGAPGEVLQNIGCAKFFKGGLSISSFRRGGREGPRSNNHHQAWLHSQKLPRPVQRQGWVIILRRQAGFVCLRISGRVEGGPGYFGAVGERETTNKRERGPQPQNSQQTLLREIARKKRQTHPARPCRGAGEAKIKAHIRTLHGRVNVMGKVLNHLGR